MSLVEGFKRQANRFKKLPETSSVALSDGRRGEVDIYNGYNYVQVSPRLEGRDNLGTLTSFSIGSSERIEIRRQATLGNRFRSLRRTGAYEDVLTAVSKARQTVMDAPEGIQPPPRVHSGLGRFRPSGPAYDRRGTPRETSGSPRY